jgi:hypothetical protein
MEATAIKNKAIGDIQAVLEIAIETAEKNGAFSWPLSEHIQKKQAKTPDKREDAIQEYLQYSDASELLTEKITLEYDLFQCDFMVGDSIWLGRRIKNGFGNGKSEQPTKNKPSELNFRSKTFQSKIANLRADYQRAAYFPSKEAESAKKAVLLSYKKAQPNDLIRLCWKWITNPKYIEGIHTAYKVEPKVIFTPY